MAQLRACGAVMAGKANMHELGAGTSGINPHHGSTRNPYNVGRVSGGSSGGSAAAVCAGLCPVALGADGGGKKAATRRLFLSCAGSSLTPLTSCRCLGCCFIQGPCACRRRSAASSGSSPPPAASPTPGAPPSYMNGHRTPILVMLMAIDTVN